MSQTDDLLRLVEGQRRKCRRLEREVAELRKANAELAVERDAADVLLGEAMDQVLASRKRTT